MSSIEVELCPNCKKPIISGIDKCPICGIELLDGNIVAPKEEKVKKGLSLRVIEAVSIATLALSVILYPFVGELFLIPAIIVLIITSLLRFIFVVGDDKKGALEKYATLKIEGILISGVALFVTIIVLVVIFIIFSNS